MRKERKMSGINIIDIGKDITITKPPKDPIPGQGVYSFIYRGKDLDTVKKIYDRGNVCLKVFRHPIPEDGKFLWGLEDFKGSDIWEATKIQNLYSFAGLAPRVYALFVFEKEGKKYYAQLTDDLGKHSFDATREQVREMNKKLQDFADKNEIEYFDDGREKNLIKGKWVDFQGYKLKDSYKDKLRSKVDKVCNWHPPSSYQPFPELGLSGRRDNSHRAEKMKLDEIKWVGKTVLDLGCSAGWFCNYALKNNAKKVVGIDFFGRADVAEELSNYLGYFNIDYYEMDLKKVNYGGIVGITGFTKFDVVLFLSMSYHIGLPQYINALTRELLIYEGNSRANDEEFENMIKLWFKKVEKVGETTDLNPRRVLWAKR
jgi:2-polyprenyl-3-methyl-5-hydroxy-6-metoxy-1,4-benzoquinol methylase